MMVAVCVRMVRFYQSINILNLVNGFIYRILFIGRVFREFEMLMLVCSFQEMCLSFDFVADMKTFISLCPYIWYTYILYAVGVESSCGWSYNATYIFFLFLEELLLGRGRYVSLISLLYCLSPCDRW